MSLTVELSKSPVVSDARQSFKKKAKGYAHIETGGQALPNLLLSFLLKLFKNNWHDRTLFYNIKK